ncbi:MAG: hypothetical protein SFT81_00960 [Candidatus Caenarcaniphilales bacterium]|nr:hypothetical protein [Candidatus Caenarcaniphilales bacterium]
MNSIHQDTLTREQSILVWVALFLLLLLFGVVLGKDQLGAYMKAGAIFGGAEPLLDQQTYQIKESGIYKFTTTRTGINGIKLYAASEDLIDDYSLTDKIYLPSTGQSLSLIADDDHILQDGLLLKLKAGSQLLLTAKQELSPSTLMIQRVSQS